MSCETTTQPRPIILSEEDFLSNCHDYLSQVVVAVNEMLRVEELLDYPDDDKTNLCVLTDVAEEVLINLMSRKASLQGKVVMSEFNEIDEQGFGDYTVH